MKEPDSTPEGQTRRPKNLRARLALEVVLTGATLAASALVSDEWLVWSLIALIGFLVVGITLMIIPEKPRRRIGFG